MRNSPAAGCIRKGGNLLTTLDEWHLHASPKSSDHWKDGRSAMENARAWVDADSALQPDVEAALAKCSDFEPVSRWCAEPEAHVAMDSFRGGQPNIDLLLMAEDDRGSFVVAIEAKADEPFGHTLDERYRSATKQCRSQVIDRIAALLKLFGLDYLETDVPQLRYQLLTAAAAALAEAQRQSAKRAVLLVHEFATSSTDAKKRKRNANDLDHFLATAFGHSSGLAPGEIVGPFGPFNPLVATCAPDPHLYVGKVRTA